MNNNHVDVNVRLVDQASSGFARLEQQTRAIQQRMAADARRTAEESARASQQSNERIQSGFSQLEQRTRAIQQRMAADARRTAEESARAARQTQDAHIRAYQAINEARERLGVRAHNQIRDDISRTREAYRTLANSGTLSWREQAQAAERMRTSVRNLTNEMGQLTHAQRAYGALQLGAGAAAGLAGGAVGVGLAMRTPVSNALSFDQRIAYLANTAFPEYDTQGRQLGAKELETQVHRAVAIGGGTPDRVTSLLEEIVGGGVLSKQEAINTLPALTKTMTANNADPVDVAALVNKLYGNGVVKDENGLARAMNMIVAAGQAGGFEFKDLAKYLPEQIGIGKSAGLTGLEGLQKILVMNEAAVMTAGTRDIAGRNVFNLLSKVTSSDTAKDFERMGRGDLGEYMMRQRAKGVDAVTVWQNIIEQELNKDPQLKKLKAQLANTKDKTEQRNLIDGISELAKGNVIVNYFQDMQAKNALLAYQNTELVNRANSIIAKNNVASGGASDRNFEPIRQTNAYRLNAAERYFEEQQKHLLDKVTPKVGSAADTAVEWGKRHPQAAQAVSAAPWVAGGAAGVAAGAWAVQRFLPAGASAAATAAPGLAAQLTPAIARASALFSGLATSATAFLSRAPALVRAATAYAAPYAPMVARASGVAGAGYAGYQVGGFINDGISKALSALAGHETNLGSAIYDLMHYKPEPVEVNTKSELTVKLAPGLLPIGQNSTATSTAPKGSNTSVMFAGRGNLWDGAP